MKLSLLVLLLPLMALAVDPPKPMPQSPGVAPLPAPAPLANPAPTLGAPPAPPAAPVKLPDAQAVELKQKLLLLANDDAFTNAYAEIRHSPKMQAFLIAEAVFFLVVLVVKSVQQALAENWFWRLLIGLVCNLVFLAGFFYAVPLAAFGANFGLITGKLWQVFGFL